MTVELPVVHSIGDFAPLPYAARVTGKNERTLQRAIARGDVHAVRLDGRTVLVSLASAKAYKPRRKVGATGEGGRDSSDVGGTPDHPRASDAQP